MLALGVFFTCIFNFLCEFLFFFDVFFERGFHPSLCQKLITFCTCTNSKMILFFAFLL
ncbi:hypothetical protein EMIT0P74_160099 [Pseudomonas sp. IT-P74]